MYVGLCSSTTVPGLCSSRVRWPLAPKLKLGDLKIMLFSWKSYAKHHRSYRFRTLGSLQFSFEHSLVSRCFLWQQTLLYFVFLYSNVHVGISNLSVDGVTLQWTGRAPHPRWFRLQKLSQAQVSSGALIYLTLQSTPPLSSPSYPTPNLTLCLLYT